MQDIEGVILAGGRATRMQGQDKGLVTLHGLPLYQWVLQRLAPQVCRVVISANRNQGFTNKVAIRLSVIVYLTFLVHSPVLPPD